MVTSFDYETLAAIVGENWTPDNETWINIEAVYKETAKTITLKFDNGEGTWSDGFDDSQTKDVTYTSGGEVIGTIPEVTAPSEDLKFSHWTATVNGTTLNLDPEELDDLTYAEAEAFFGISEGDVVLTAVYEPVSVSITVQFVDVVTGEQVGGPYTMDVPVGTTQINTYSIPNEWIPDGYEVAQAGDVNIDENGVATVKVRRTAPTDKELKAYLWNLQVDCSTEGHEPIQTGLLPDSYTTKGDGLGIQGNVYVIQLSTEPYVQKYIEAGYSQEHTSVSGDTMLLYLTHDGTKWIAPANPTVMLNCEPVYTINVSFVDEDGVTSLGGGDVISTDPDRELEIADPTAPAGKTFVGWKAWIGASPMYEGKFTYSDLSQLDLSWYENKASVTFQAVYEENVKTINVSFVDEDGVTSLGGGDVISTDPDRELEIADPTAPRG